MLEYSTDSDEKIGAYIYRTSRTAQLLREEAAARNNETANNDNNITRPKRKSHPNEVENALVSSEPKECSVKKKRKKYIYLPS